MLRLLIFSKMESEIYNSKGGFYYSCKPRELEKFYVQVKHT